MPSDPSVTIFNREVLPILTGHGMRALCRSLANKMTSFADADDFVQAASLRAWNARASFIPGSNAKAWCHVIALNVARSAAKKRTSEARNMGVAVHDPSFTDAHLTYRTPGLPSGVTADTSAPIEDQIDTSTEWREVASDIHGLRDVYREAIEDLYLHDEDWNESAIKRQCPRNSIAMRRSRGMSALRAAA